MTTATSISVMIGLVLPITALTWAGAAAIVGRSGPARLRPRSVAVPTYRAPAIGSGPGSTEPARAGSIVHTLVRARSRSPRPPTDTEVAQWCDRIARRVRAGESLVASIRTVEYAPAMRAAMGPALLHLDRGADLATALRTVDRRTPGVDLALTVLLACARLGGRVAEPIDRAAAAVRRRVADEAERRTHSAQARASALTMTALPGAVLLLLATTSASVRQQLTQTPGAICVVAGAALNLTGWRWMRRIVGSAP